MIDYYKLFGWVAILIVDAAAWAVFAVLIIKLFEVV